MSEELNKLLEIEREAERIVESARVEAKKIIEEAKKKAEQIIMDAEESKFPELEEKIKRELDSKLKEIEDNFKEEAKKVRDVGYENLDKAVEFVVKEVVK